MQVTQFKPGNLTVEQQSWLILQREPYKSCTECVGEEWRMHTEDEAVNCDHCHQITHHWRFIGDYATAGGLLICPTCLPIYRKESAVSLSY